MKWFGTSSPRGAAFIFHTMSTFHCPKHLAGRKIMFGKIVTFSHFQLAIPSRKCLRSYFKVSLIHVHNWLKVYVLGKVIRPRYPLNSFLGADILRMYKTNETLNKCIIFPRYGFKYSYLKDTSFYIAFILSMMLNQSFFSILKQRVDRSI